jgi:CO/xanthine dehydrogenase FAD-binding subunit
MTEVFLPRGLEELWDILDKHRDTAVYAGGTDLLVKLRSGLAKPSCLACLERIEALSGVHDTGEEVVIGCAVTHNQLLESPIITQNFPVLAMGLSVLGSPPIRHMGTIGGNIVTASPAGDTLPPLYVLEAELEIRSKNSSRRAALAGFILGPGKVDLNRGEILTRIFLKKSPKWSIHHYEKAGRRKGQACAVASMAALLELSETGSIERARFAWGSVGPTVVTSREVEEALVGQPISLEIFKSVSDLVKKAVSPIDDVRASAEYRRVVAAALVQRLAAFELRPDLGRNRMQSR